MIAWSLIKRGLRTPLDLWQLFRVHGGLIRQLTIRNILGRYKGSYLGMLWTFLNPVLMLAVYTFAFNVVFKSSWPIKVSDSQLEYSLTLFVGLIVFNLFNEVVNRSPGIILSNPNYVKKVVFPVEILPLTVMGEALFHALISMLILIAGLVLFMGIFPWTLILLPLVFLPVVFLTLGLSWLLAALGVFVRDMGYVVGILTTVLFFVTPVFYAMNAVPASIQPVLALNPLAVIVDTCRGVAVWTHLPNWTWFAYGTGVSLACFIGGYVFFMVTKKSFADVM